MRPSRVVLALLVGLAPHAASAQIRLGPELQVNTYTTGHQTSPSVAWQPGGGFVVAWESEPASPAASGIFAQRFDAFGARLGAEIQVKPATTTAFSRRPEVASDANGGFVVVWNSHLANGSRGVVGRRYNSSGVAQGGELTVDTHPIYSQFVGGLAPRPDGGFVVVWDSVDDGSGRGTFGRRYDGSGTALGGEFRVNTFTTGHQLGGAIASDAAGNFVVVWHSLGQDGSGGGIFGQRFDTFGGRVGGEFEVNTHTPGPQYWALVASDADGRSLVAWRTMHQDGDQDGVFARRFDASGEGVGSDFRVNTFTAGYQILNGLAADQRGNFVVVWFSEGALDGGGYAVMARLYDATGRPHSGEFVVNSYGPASQSYPSVAFAPDGRFVVAWHDNGGHDGHGHGIFAQVFAQDLMFRDGFQ